ncbi:MAG: DUF1269 domain-containing protein [Brachymonas sp.]
MSTNIVLVTWADSAKAYKALSDIRGGTWNLNVTQAAIVERAANGSITLKDGANTQLGLGSLGGGIIGALVGVLGGPLGVLLGWASGALFGSLVDVSRVQDDTIVLASMSSFIPAYGTALILDINEESSDKLDAFVKESGGTLMRCPAEAVRAEVAAAMEAADAAVAEARRVLREKKWSDSKEKIEDAWDNVKARFRSTFSKDA